MSWIRNTDRQPATTATTLQLKSSPFSPSSTCASAPTTQFLSESGCRVGKNPAQWVFLGFLFFFVFLWFFGFFYIFAQKKEFLGFFQFQEYF
jgi:hypothetical protein